MSSALFVLRLPGKAVFFSYFLLTYWVKRLTERRTVFLYPPQKLHRRYQCWKLFNILGLRIVPSPVGAAICCHHEDITSRPMPAGHETYINGRSTDISKRRVEELFREIFGYSSLVDPETHAGLLVQKSDKNCAHDGKIMSGPITPTPGYVYQILIDNDCGDGRILDYRVSIIGSEIAYVVKKYRPIETRFSGVSVTAQVFKDARDVFSSKEIDGIFRLCRKIGLDVGEIDILRDKNSGRFYIIDVNCTPHAPAGALLGIRGILYMHRAAKIFERQFLS